MVTCLFGAIKVYRSLKAFVVKYRPFPLAIHCSSSKMDGMEIRFLCEGRALLRSSTRIKKAFPWLCHWSLAHFLLFASATTSNNFYIFRCRQGLSPPTVVLVVDDSFDGYPATHVYYRWIICIINKQAAAMSSRIHVFSVSNIYSILWIRLRMMIDGIAGMDYILAKGALQPRMLLEYSSQCMQQLFYYHGRRMLTAATKITMT
ncbi:predicted protein [Lichtheimia corymbifera JMRC:FSU:9682]|uniref:Uncharacterized protein n=1 Tax=Lichtheimia corymbifera JMRC:FSU:9682 TaxID=1263082 RepID=A0A068RUG7_9FUNG|nr:predicted protein [Lichtheimia corymbifera JMRC:FSU:9682]